MGLAEMGFAKHMQEDAQDFQLQVLKNQIQWRYDDMRAAGINPILAAQGGIANAGGGTASPGGGDAIGQAINSAKEAAFAKRQFEGLQLANANTSRDTILKRNQSEDVDAHRVKTDAEADLIRRTIEPNAKRAEAEFATAAETARYTKALADKEETDAQLLSLMLPGARSQAQAQSSGAGKATKKAGTIIENVTAPLGKVLGGGVTKTYR